MRHPCLCKLRAVIQILENVKGNFGKAECSNVMLCMLRHECVLPFNVHLTVNLFLILKKYIEIKI